MKLKKHLVPPSGFKFKEKDGSIQEAESWPHLVRVVAQYRAMRKLPPGDPAREITDQACTANPNLCHNGPGEIGDGDHGAFHIRVANWMATIVQKVRNKMIRFIEPLEAQRRAEICRSCPFQEGWQVGCPSCSKSGEALTKQVIGDRPEAGVGLLGCGILSEDTVISVHLNEPSLVEPRLPKHCWRKE